MPDNLNIQLVLDIAVVYTFLRSLISYPTVAIKDKITMKIRLGGVSMQQIGRMKLYMAQTSWKVLDTQAKIKLKKIILNNNR